MHLLLRKLANVARMGLTWGIVWAVVGAVAGLVVRLTTAGSTDRGVNEFTMGALYGALGFLGGTAFGALVSLGRRGRIILHLSPLRAAMWGVVASAALPLLLSMHEILALMLSVFGALSALAAVVIRRAEARHVASARSAQIPQGERALPTHDVPAHRL